MLPLSPFILSTIRTERNKEQHKLNTHHTEDVVKGRAFNHSFWSRPQGHRQWINFLGRHYIPSFFHQNKYNTGDHNTSVFPEGFNSLRGSSFCSISCVQTLHFSAGTQKWGCWVMMPCFGCLSLQKNNYFLWRARDSEDFLHTGWVTIVVRGSLTSLTHCTQKFPHYHLMGFNFYSISTLCSAP